MANTRSTPPTLHRPAADPIAAAVTWQPTLFGGEPGCDTTFAGVRRIPLDETAWVEHAPGWVRGTDALFDAVVAAAPWEQRRVHMYERVVDEPRLTAWYGSALDDPTLPDAVREMTRALSVRYDRSFDGIGAALYRDGRDSVAWHGDRIDPALVEPVVALVSLGSRRTLRMRAKEDRRASRAFDLAPGDLFVMGGTSQRTWEHSVPKVARAGPRLSLQFRHSR